MLRHFILILISMVLFFTSQAQTNGDDLMQLEVDVVYLASDLLEGRQTGTEGEQKAAKYIAHRFEELGLDHAPGYSDYYQEMTFQVPVNPHAPQQGKGKEIEGINVLGYQDNNAEYTVVIGGHYDHLGYGMEGSLHAGEPVIHNGADDNASGIAALLYIAEKLKATEAKSNNYLFIAFSGEEYGLYGSKYFTKHAKIDLDKVNYMFNMDMVGRLNEERVLAVNGAGTSPAFNDLLKDLKFRDITAKTSESGIGPSDHTAFYLEEIPVLHFFTGQHQDYHKPTDDAHLVNYKGIKDVADYMIRLIEELDDDGELVYQETTQPEEQKVERFKVTLGVMPDYVYNGEGMRIDAVIPGRPAQKAGLEDGDIIVKIGDMDITDIYKYMEALSKYETGQKAVVVVVRDGDKKELEVTF